MLDSDLPSAQRTSLRLREYLELAAQGKPNTTATVQAQAFARCHLLGLGDDALRKCPNTQPNGAEREIAQARYGDLVRDVVKSLCGADFQIAVEPLTMLRMIERTHPEIYHTTRKVGVNIGAVPAISPSGR
jgi:hypothetical protein